MHLPQAQSQTLMGRVNVQDPYPNGVTFLHHIARVQKAPFRQLRDVDQALDAFLDPHKGAETHYIGHHALDQLTYMIA